MGFKIQFYAATDTFHWGAVLAAWMRLKYPHVAVGALASSAPILQFEDIVPSTIFYDLVSDDFKVYILHYIVLLDECKYDTKVYSCMYMFRGKV